MAAPTPQERLDELLHLLERHRDLSDRLETLSAPELAEFHSCCKKIDDTVTRVVVEEAAAPELDAPGGPPLPPVRRINRRADRA